MTKTQINRKKQKYNRVQFVLFMIIENEKYKCSVRRVLPATLCEGNVIKEAVCSIKIHLMNNVHDRPQFTFKLILILQSVNWKLYKYGKLMTTP